MQRIERYGVIALVFLLVTILAVSLWGEGKEELFASDEGAAEEVVAAAPAAALPVARTSPVSTRGARDRALPTSDNSRARDAAPRDRDHSRNPHVLDPEPAASPLAGRSARAASAPITPEAFPREEPSMRRQEEPRAIAPSPTEYVPADPTPRTARAVVPAAREAVAPAGARTCVVGKGETLSEISQRELGTCKRWREIAALNGDLDPAKLKQGTVLALPPRDPAQVVAAASQPAPRPAAASAPAETTPRTGGGARTYRVRKGDVLSVIAQRELGTSKRWKEIVALNPKIDPDRLIVGAELKLPGGQREVETAAAAPKVSPSSVARAEPARQGGWSGSAAGGKVR